MNVKIQDIKSNKKLKNISEARQICMFLARELTSASFPDIGDKIGGRDHSTVIYSFNKIKDRLQQDLNLNEMIDAIRNKILNSN